MNCDSPRKRLFRTDSSSPLPRASPANSLRFHEMLPLYADSPLELGIAKSSLCNPSIDAMTHDLDNLSLDHNDLSPPTSHAAGHLFTFDEGFAEHSLSPKEASIPEPDSFHQRLNFLIPYYHSVSAIDETQKQQLLDRLQCYTTHASRLLSVIERGEVYPSVLPDGIPPSITLLGTGVIKVASTAASGERETRVQPIAKDHDARRAFLTVLAVGRRKAALRSKEGGGFRSAVKKLPRMRRRHR